LCEDKSYKYVQVLHKTSTTIKKSHTQLLEKFRGYVRRDRV